MNMMEYKGYLGTVEYSSEDHCLYGKLAYIRDLVNYEANTVADLEAEFRLAVDDYLATCHQMEKEPNKPFKGSFNVRTGPELHRAAVVASKGQSLNAFVCDAIKEKVKRCEAEA
ncbi:type II toxin-antitoxin system HicB family antitoxin [Marinomonas agarivorans]|nr:type II toxin-antitoxin system HicB family antitoxin [Marinomonas agarivorans]